jgi:hypothetical protein
MDGKRLRRRMISADGQTLNNPVGAGALRKGSLIRGAAVASRLALGGSNELSDRVIKRTLADLLRHRERISTIGRKMENC